MGSKNSSFEGWARVVMLNSIKIQNRLRLVVSAHKLSGPGILHESLIFWFLMVF
jgi:hypothetical protein